MGSNEAIIPHQGSFRDPSGRIYFKGERVLRSITPYAADSYCAVRDSGFYRELVDEGLLLGLTELDPAEFQAEAKDAAYVLEHPRLHSISYPYEWCFSALRRAALLHLEIHLKALKRGFTLSDASAYNIQFQGPKPVFIDHLSLRPWREGEIWAGHHQFCMQFLNPLLLSAKLNIPPNHWLRGNLEGITPEEMARLLPLRHCLSWTVLSHVRLQAFLQLQSLKSPASDLNRIRKKTLSLLGFQSMLEGLRDYIKGLTLPAKQTVWSDYATHNSYAAAETEAKSRFIAEAITRRRPNLVWDIGCNTGNFPAIALKAGAGSIVGWDIDHGALEQAFTRAERDHLNFLPLWLDAANPSPNHGWAQREREGFFERSGRTDMILSLAFLHHMVIGRNVPMEWAIDWLISLAPSGIIEFAHKSDPMVQRLLALRDDIFPDYHEDAFLKHISRRARIISTETLASGTRLLVHYDRS